jgi:hypothetical protein
MSNLGKGSELDMDLSMDDWNDTACTCGVDSVGMPCPFCECQTWADDENKGREGRITLTRTFATLDLAFLLTGTRKAGSDTVSARGTHSVLSFLFLIEVIGIASLVSKGWHKQIKPH